MDCIFDKGCETQIFWNQRLLCCNQSLTHDHFTQKFAEATGDMCACACQVVCRVHMTISGWEGKGVRGGKWQ